MKTGKRTITKRLRFLALQEQQLDQLLITNSMNFTDFVHWLIGQAFMKTQHTVPKETEGIAQPEPEIKKRHRRPEKILQRPAPKADPKLLLELGRIGNNLNQMARALNIIKNANPQEQRKLDIFSVLLVLRGIQTELEQVFPALPKIGRQSPDRLKKQLEDLNVDQALPSIVLAEQDESAY